MNSTLCGLLAFVAAASLASCAGSGAQLNSDRIEREFGNYGVDVLHADGHRRISSLYSGSAESKTTRTYAVVDFPGEPRPAYRDEHELIVAGQSIGKTFRDAEWSIRKQNLFIGELVVPPAYADLAVLMRIDLPATLAVHQYLFVVSKEERSWTYATITEVHHPDFLTATELRETFGEILLDDSNRDSIHDFIGPPRGK